MFAAYNLRGDLVYAILADKDEEYNCVNCDKKVKLVISKNRKNYFSHIAKRQDNNNETSSHKIAKKILKQDFRKNGYITHEEIYINNNHQRIDVYAEKGNLKLALEFQNSPISVQNLDDRIKGYQINGYKSIWFLSKNYYLKLSKKQLKFLNYSSSWKWYLLFLDEEKRQYILLFNILFVGIEPNIKYKKKIFNSLYDLLNFKIKDYQIVFEKRYNQKEILNYCYVNQIYFNSKFDNLIFPPILKFNIIKTLFEYSKNKDLNSILIIPAQIKIKPHLLESIISEVSIKLNSLLFLIKRNID